MVMVKIIVLLLSFLVCDMQSSMGCGCWPRRKPVVPVDAASAMKDAGSIYLPTHAEGSRYEEYHLPVAADQTKVDPVVWYAERLFKIATKSAGVEHGVKGFFAMLFEPKYQALLRVDKLKVLSIEGQLRDKERGFLRQGISSWIREFYKDDEEAFLIVFENEKHATSSMLKKMHIDCLARMALQELRIGVEIAAAGARRGR